MTFDSLSNDNGINCGEKLSNEERLLLQYLLNKYKSCFSKSLGDLGFTDAIGMVVELEDAEPIVSIVTF